MGRDKIYRRALERGKEEKRREALVSKRRRNAGNLEEG